MLASTAFYLFISSVQGYSEFLTNCTTPTSQTSYVFSPNTRGTLDILWSCFFTIIASTWTIQHLNVPEQPNEQRSRDQRWYEAWRSLTSLWRSTKWMLITIVAPEYIFGKALADLYAAVESKRKMQIFVREDGVEWGLTHAFFANMGGFVLSQRCLKITYNDRYANPAFIQELGLAPIRNCYEVRPTVLINQRVSNDRSGASAGRVSMSMKQAGGESVLMLPNNTWETTILTRSGGQISYRYRAPFHLLASDISTLRREGVLRKLPNIHASNIDDKSKGDAFTKLIAACQVFWFILQVIERAIQRLSISQLEIAVTAFGACAIITYLLLLQKPKGVSIPITLMEFGDHIPIASEPFALLRQRTLQGYLRGLFALGQDIIHDVDVAGSHIPNDALETGPAVVLLHAGVAIGGVIFGAIHLAAWNSIFPTPLEQTLWRVASMLSISLLPVMYIVLLLDTYVYPLALPPLFMKSWNIVFGSLYVVARAFLLVEIFRTLFYLGPDTYLTTWVGNVPHVS